MEDLVTLMRRSMGLTLYEAKLYIAMLRGARNPREASSMSGVPLPRIYDVVRALEGKGFVEPDPGGWYRPRPPRAVAAAMLTRIEEEARSRAKLVLEVSEKLASLTEPPRPREGVVTVAGPYSIASAIAEASRGAPVVYIIASNVLQTHADLLESIVKNAAGITPVVRVILGPRIGREVEDRLKSLGIEVKVSRPHIIDLAVTPTILIIILSDPYRREPIGVIVRDPDQASHAYTVVEDLWISS